MPPPDDTSAAPRPTPRSAPKAFGTIVPGYEIVGEIARGAMGVVDEARHQGLQRTVALKMTLSGGAASEDELLRFKFVLRLHPDDALSRTVRIIKANSSGWVHRFHATPELFNWQRGYGAFSVSRSQEDRVRAYIRNQEQHHRKRNSQSEWDFLMRVHGFEWVPDEEPELEDIGTEG